MGNFGKKVVSASLAVLTSVTMLGGGSFVAVAGAATSAELQAQINALLAQLQSLQTTTVSCTVPAQPLTVGSTGANVTALQNWLVANGYGSFTATGYFGAMTQAAVVKFQVAKGITPAVGYYGPVTMAAVQAMCTTSTTTTTTTTTNTNTTTTSGDEGELKNFDSVSADENSIEEGQEGVEIFAFEMEADGSDMKVNRVDIYLDETAGASDSDNADDYFDVFTLLVDGKKVADLDVDDLDEENYQLVTGSNGDEFRARFVTNFTVEAGDTAKVTLEVDTNSTIDSGDESATWVFSLETDSVRATDGSGFTDEYGMSSEKTVAVDGPTAGDLDVSLNSDNPEEAIIEVDATDDTNGVEVLAFDLEANDGDVDITDLRVTIDDVGTLTDVDQVVNTLHLICDGDEIASESVTAATGQTEIVTFDVDGEMMIADGDTLECSVEADINNLDGGDFDGGDGIVVSFTSLDAEDEAGDNVEADGTANGENMHFYTVAPQIAKVSTSITKTAGDNAGTEATDDTADGTIVFTVKAVGGTIYVNGDDETTDEIEGILLTNGQGGDLDVLGDYSYSVTGANITTTNGGADNEYFTIPEGATATFTLSFHLDPAATGFFGGNVASVQFGTDLTDQTTRSASTITFGVVADDLETSLVQLTDGA